MNKRLFFARGWRSGQRQPLAGLLLGCLILLVSTPAGADPADVTFDPSVETVEVFDFVEVTLRVAAPDAANPFVDTAVSGEFARQGAAPVTVDGFCDAPDGSLYRVRFMPMSAGRTPAALPRATPGGADRCGWIPSGRSILSGPAPASITSGTARPRTI
jgi:hypothetical protein